MAEKTKSPESFVPLLFPTKGLEVTSEFSSQPQQTTSVANNVRGFEPMTGRERGGQRSGISRYLPQLATGGKIQHLNFIVDPQADALIADIDHFGPEFADYIDDPSTNNNAAGRGNRNNGRRFRRGGSGRQPNRQLPRIQRTHVTITWSDPADITFGTPLSGAQLNATAAVGILPIPGTFTYVPPSGTVLPIGSSQALGVTFTPTDSGLYFSETKTVHINVTPPALFRDQSNGDGTTAPVASLAVTMSFNTNVGDCILVFVATYGAGVTSNAISDAQGRTYSLIRSRTSGTLKLWVYRTMTTVAAPLTVTVTPNTNAYITMSVNTVAGGVNPTTPIGGSIDSTGTATDTIDSGTTGLIPVTTAGSMIWGMFAQESGNLPAHPLTGSGTGMTNIDDETYGFGPEIGNMTVHYGLSTYSADKAVTTQNVAAMSTPYQAIGISVRG
jgi:hypothetical protein